MRVFFSVFLCMVGLYATPPPVPGGGVIERQLEKEYEDQPLEFKEELPRVEIDLPEEKLDLPTGLSVYVKEICVEGNESISSREIESWVSSFRDRDLTMGDVEELCLVIEAGYAKKGYFIARAYPPPQTIEGCLTIRVIEGKLGEITVEGNQFYSEGFIRSYFKRFQGKTLHYSSFMRALFLLNENSDLEANVVFVKGKEFGTVDLVIRVQDKRATHLYVNANNYGKDLTTNWRMGARLDYGNLFTYGDQLTLAQVVGFPMHSLYFTDLIYSVPLNRKGLTMQLDYLFSRFTVQELRELDLAGYTNIGSLKFIQALTRTREMSIDLQAWFDFMQVENLQQDSIIAFDKLRVFRFAAIIDRFASVSVRNYLQLQMSVGVPDFLWGLHSVDSRCSRQGAGGLFVKLQGNYDYLQRLFSYSYLSLHLSGQWSFYRLAIPEQVYLGGADTVRGYPLAVALGDSGYYGNLEWHFPPPFLANLPFFMAKAKWKDRVQLVGFIDHGGAFIKSGSHRLLTGAGIGMRINNIFQIFNFSVDVSFPLARRDLSKGMVTYLKLSGCLF